MIPDSWRPPGARSKKAEDLEPGMIVAIDYVGFRHKPWRVHEVRARGEDGVRLYLRPLGDQYDLAEHNHMVNCGKRLYIPVLGEHYSVCGKCGDLQPCAEVWSERVAGAVAKRSARYEIEGVCPACEEPITARQGSHSFEENIYAPLGPPVTFHNRQKCLAVAIDYDAELAKRRECQPLLSCDGTQTRHQDGSYGCSNESCPGVETRHRAFRQCYITYGSLEACQRPECGREGETS